MEKKDQGAQKETLFLIYNLHIQNNHTSLEIQMTRYLKNGSFKQPSSFHPDGHFSLIKDTDKDVISQIYIG
jgi:hypothetical protein